MSAMDVDVPSASPAQQPPPTITAATAIQPVKLTVSAQNVIETLRRAKGLGSKLKEAQEKLTVLQKDSQRALDDEDDAYNDDLKDSLQKIQMKIALALEQHRAILENIQIYQSKNQQLASTNTQLGKNPELKPKALALRNEAEEMLRFVVSQTLNLEKISDEVEKTLDDLSPYNAVSLPPELQGWTENVPLLYDTLICYDLEYPSFACAWGAKILDTQWKNNRFHYQKLLVTRAPDDYQSVSTGVPSTLDVLETKLPTLRVFDEKKLISNLDPRRRKEVPYKSRIVHPGMVNRMKPFPMLPDVVVASCVTSSMLCVWNTKTQPNRAVRAGALPNDPDVILCGLTSFAAYGMDVHSSQPLIAAGDVEGNFFVWSLDDDVSYDANYPNSRGLNARSRLKAHRGAIEDIVFHPTDPFTVFTGGVDGNLMLWDLRIQPYKASVKTVFDKSDITALSWNRHSDHLLLAGCARGRVRLLDLRKADTPVAESFTHPNHPVSSIQWCPNHFNIFASTATNNSMFICDSEKLGFPAPADFNDGLPGEVIFSHEAQMGEIVSFDWNPHEPLMLATLCERDKLNNDRATVNIWRPSDFLFMDRTRFISMVRDLSDSPKKA